MAGIGISKLIFITQSIKPEHQVYLEELCIRYSVSTKVYSYNVLNHLQLSNLITRVRNKSLAIQGMINCAMNLKVSPLYPIINNFLY